MGFFDRFRSKTPTDPMQDHMKRLAPVLFPGGHEQILSTGRSIAGLLDNRITADSAAKLFASTKYLAHTTSDKSRARIAEYIVRQGMGRITLEEAGIIYDRFVINTPTSSKPPPSPQPPPDSDAVYINVDLAGNTYRLQNSFRTVEIGAMIFTVMLVGLKGQGWAGAPHLFTPDGSAMKPLSGIYQISDRDAHDLAVALRGLVTSSGLDTDTERMIAPLISIASQGAFEVHT
jgi:hypothetical protein